jgi:hypothetical protein
MSSVNAVMAIPTLASYNASKGGIDQLTRAMALALVDRGIRVNAVAPGTIATELARKAVPRSAEAKEKILGRTPLRRLGEPAEIASVCAFLASDAASYITGEIVVVDGGRMALNYTMPPLPGRDAPLHAGTAATRGGSRGLADRQVDQRRADGQHDVGVPHPVVAAGRLERLAAEPGAEEAADLVREHDEAEQRRHVRGAVRTWRRARRSAARSRGR